MMLIELSYYEFSHILQITSKIIVMMLMMMMMMIMVMINDMNPGYDITTKPSTVKPHASFVGHAVCGKY